MPQIDANGIAIHYELCGPADAPVVLLSNSLGTRLEMWDPQLPALSQRYRVLRYDSRGHGRSAAPAGPYTIELLADDALGLLDALGIERAHFCGLSMGGMVGQVLGARHPERLRSLTLCSTACHMTPKEIWDERIEAVREGGMAAVADGVVERWFTEAFRAEPSIVVERVRQMILETPAHGYAACCAAIRDMDLRETIRGDPPADPDHRRRRRPGDAARQGRGDPRAHRGRPARGHPGCGASRQHRAGRGVRRLAARRFSTIRHELRRGEGAMASELFEKGLKKRKEVLGAAHVERSLAGADDFSRPYQELVTEYCWGAVWDRPGLVAQDPEPAQPRHADRAQPRGGVQAPRPRRVPQRRDQGGDPRGPAAGDDLLRRAGGQLGLQAGARGVRRRWSGRRAPTLSELRSRRRSLMG